MAKRSCTVRGFCGRSVCVSREPRSKTLEVYCEGYWDELTVRKARKLFTAGLTMCDESEKGAK